MGETVFAVRADWAGHSISREVNQGQRWNMREVSSIDVNLWGWGRKRQSSRMIPSKVKKRHLGGGWRGGVMTPASRTLAPSPIMVHRDKYLHTLSAKRTSLSASCSHPMLLENREQMGEQGRWETLAAVPDWLGCDTCSYTNKFKFVAASSAEKKLLMPTPSATTNVQG